MQNTLNYIAAKYTENFQQLYKVKRLIYVVIILLIFVNTSYADIAQAGPNSYVAGVNSNEVVFFIATETAGRQRRDQWCWAAGIQMVLNYHGLYVTQEQIVQMIKGQQLNQGGTHDEIIRALNGRGIDNRGRISTVRAFSGYLTPETLINTLVYKYPLIAELSNSDGSGHAVVLTAVGFHMVSSWNGYG